MKSTTVTVRPTASKLIKRIQSPTKILHPLIPHTYIIFFLRFNFIYFWLHWVFVAARRLSLVVASGGYSSLRCTGFSFVVASLVAEHGL